jgi:predicted permease
MTRLWQDVVYAFRTFAKAPGFTAIAILVLAIGVGANTAIFSIVNEFMLRPLSGRTGELVGAYSHDRTQAGSFRAFSYPNYADIRDQSGLFDGLIAHRFSTIGTTVGDETRRTLAALVSSNYFDTLGVHLAAGRTFTPEEERPSAGIPVAIATYTRWQKEQLDPAFVGRTIRINAKDFTIVGVAPEGFTGTMALVSADVYLPLGMYDTVVASRPAVGFPGGPRTLGDRKHHNLAVAGRLKPGLTDAFVSSRLDALSRQLEAAYPAENKDQLLSVTPLPRMSASSTPDSDAPLGTLSALLLGLSSVVLVIACLNVANMLLARGAARSKELAVRLALGARRARIVRQLLTEGILLAAAGAGLGLLLSYWATHALATSLMSVFPFTASLNGAPDIRVLAATLGFAALSTIAFGLGPALRLSRRDLVADLKDRGGEGASTGRRFGARNLMVIGQVALSLGLLTAGGIFARTAITASGGNPGYAYDRLLLASLDNGLGGFDEPRGRAIYGAVLDRARSLRGVSTVSMTSTLPFSDTQQSAALERVGVSGKEPARARTYRVIGADHFAALGLSMVRGREFTRAEEESASAPRVAIVDEALARRLFEGEDPIGQMIRVAQTPGEPESTLGEPMQIVGIAPPLIEELLDRAPVPHVYVPFGRHYRAGMHLEVRLEPGANELASLEALRSAIRAAEPGLPVLILSTMQAFHDKSLELWALRTGAQLFSALGGLALLLAVVGVYGVKSYIVSQRTREIGIRMALGASARDVVGLVLRDGFFLTGAGVALGVPLAILVSFALASVFVDVGGFDGLVVSVATIVLAVSATIASAVPARRASRVQPLRALQGD